jgi:hypothetical protein
MSPNDNEPLHDIPHMVPDRDDVAEYQRQKQGRSKPAERQAAGHAPEDAPADTDHGHESVSGGISRSLFAVVTIALLGWAGYLNWQLVQTQTRVMSLEQRLSVTDESVNQSGLALQVKIKDLDAMLTQIRDETLDKQKSRIDQHSAQLASLDKALKHSQSALSQNNQRDEEQRKSLDGVRGQLDKISPLVDANTRKVDAQQAVVAAADSKLGTLAAQQRKLEKRVGINEEWVQSINTFRVQTNRELVNIKQQMVAGKAAPAPIEPGPR